ncbi:hypothetical protein SeLEV6574_g07182 [Synchytrium endobioticum]|uniref:C2H2-type domain-containing protein n=1 Tax=Synchytrium endobioticum TaxID=286115 RepID=A0A507CIT6_9FUNG|nr:hypothetical protein SeLEV6574_g07182 [Synchytrium endobioticum]
MNSAPQDPHLLSLPSMRQDDHLMYTMNDLLQRGSPGLLDEEIVMVDSSASALGASSSTATSSATSSAYQCCGIILADLHDLLQHHEAYHDEEAVEEIEILDPNSSALSSPAVRLDRRHFVLQCIPHPPPLLIPSNSNRTATPSPYGSPTYSPLLPPGFALPFDALSALQLGTPVLPLPDMDPVSVSLSDIYSAPSANKSVSSSASYTPIVSSHSSAILPGKGRIVQPQTFVGRTPPPMPSFINTYTNSTSTLKRARSRESSYPYTPMPTSRLSSRATRPSRLTTTTTSTDKTKKPRKYVHERFVHMRNAHLHQEKEREMMMTSIPSPPHSTHLSSSGSSSDDDDDDENMSDLESIDEFLHPDDSSNNMMMVLTRYGRVRQVIHQEEINDEDVIGIVVGKAEFENDDDDIPLSDLALEKAMPGCITRQSPQKVRMKETNGIKVIPGYTMYKCVASGCTKRYKHPNGLKLHLQNVHPSYAQAYLQQRKVQEHPHLPDGRAESVTPHSTITDATLPVSVASTPSSSTTTAPEEPHFDDNGIPRPKAPNPLYPRDFSPHIYDPTLRDRGDFSCHFIGCYKSYKNGSGIRYHLNTFVHPQQHDEAAALAKTRMDGTAEESSGSQSGNDAIDAHTPMSTNSASDDTAVTAGTCGAQSADPVAYNNCFSGSSIVDYAKTSVPLALESTGSLSATDTGPAPYPTPRHRCAASS